jgi:Holliday junction DNA helicase RuvA
MLKSALGGSDHSELFKTTESYRPGAEDQKLNDAVLALMALGFKQIDAHDAVRAASRNAGLGVKTTVEDLVRACLKKGT